MNIAVLNGSPKGEYSITLQTVRYLEKRFPAHSFRVIHVGQRIRALEKDLSDAAEAISEAQLVLFCYPVYTFLAPSQLHRFIELMKRHGLSGDGKYATQITTSKHFYDVTAHRYIEENAADLGFRVIRGLSADMDDLLTARGQADADAFLQYVEFCMKNGLSEPKDARVPAAEAPYLPQLAPVEKREGFDTLILTDCATEEGSLAAMIKDFQAAFPYPTRTINLNDFPFAGGCLGCFKCAADGKCCYKDGFDVFLRERIQTADAIVYAFNVRDHSMGALFKRYDDRQFCNGHRTVTMGMPMGYLIAGDYAGEGNLRTVIEARCEVGHNFLAGTATDAETVQSMAGRLAYALEHGYVPPQNFYGVGGMKIFRDLIYVMRGMMKADHRFYKAHGIYDFPQKKIGTILKIQLVGGLLTNKRLAAKMGNKMNEGMIAPYRKVLAAAAPLRDRA